MKNCRYMRSSYNWTPSDYELRFNHKNIPSNINLKDVPDLSLLVQSHTPLSKKIHLMLEEQNSSSANSVGVNSRITITQGNKTRMVKYK